MLGKLSGLLALPLDIFFEITSHLHPLDLLHLSRASRHFARMFLHTENRHAWLAAHRTVEGLPDCPSDISEARYAHLLFESVCSRCGKMGRRLLFNLRVRFCTPCYKVKVMTHAKLEGGDPSLEAVLRIVPHNYSGTDSSVVEYFPDKLTAVKEELTKACAAGSGDDFLKEKQAAVSALIDHGELVSKFLEELQKRKELERMRLRETRKSQINARIMELGYKRDEIPEEDAAYQEEIQKPKALTDRAWQGMAARMGALAATRRVSAFNKRFGDRFREWTRVYRTMYSRYEYPDPLNAAKVTMVARLLADEHARISFTISRFGLHANQIYAELVAWRDKAQQEIMDKVAAAYGLPCSAAGVDRASAVIRCVDCAQLLFASGVMFHLHECSRRSLLWTERSWGYDVGLHQIARALLHHAGFADDVSSEQVNELRADLQYECSRFIMGFLGLVEHLWQESWSCDETFKFHKLGSGPLGVDNASQAAKKYEGPAETGVAILIKLILPLSSTSTSLHPHTTEEPLKDDDPCCRQCGNACFMQVDMRSEPQAARHMQATHGQAGVGEADLCPARDVFAAAREYASAHEGQVIVTRMVGR